MIQKPNGYDEAQAFTGEYETLSLGGHVCIIKGCRVITTKNDTSMLQIAFDIDRTDPQGGFYSRQFERNKAQHGADAKWPAGGQTRVGLEGKSVPYFKGFITAVEESNPGYKWNWDELTLKGKRFGGIFGEEEYLNSSGEKRTAVKLFFLRSVAAIKEGVEIPLKRELKPASPSPSAPTGYENGITTPNGKHIPADLIEIEEELPF